ncbi:transcriptional regulator [Arthrobacter sp. ERGS1:01]|uniref:FMN-binding negative transcriptional regulator n=1 Tax=Arthrobacter sp. ERGS1:01 TaxID=1704044 RepID=UPI0006B595A9|nr:FMN-binding negative transcriptional regulator [Arthrobacter sp. ERGS1:01]ALE06851.1 transcriptional regulator [Arthrobacter sp. ERGS1:01]
MYIPEHFTAGPAAIQDLLSGPSAANLVTMSASGLLATLLPFVYDPTIGEHGALHAHLARNNTQWSEAAIGESLAIIQGPDSYISPTWYASKADHGRVVPTWNYTTAHVYGHLAIHDDVDWLGRHVRALTVLNETGSEHPWAVDDAPERFISGQLRAIVGIELVITRIEAKTKLSQNRPAKDIAGVVAGLQGTGHAQMAAQVEQAGTS